jgi:hypothetical protein
MIGKMASSLKHENTERARNKASDVGRIGNKRAG